MYADAVDEARRHGEFSYFYSYMSQPKVQLETFREWAGKSSDISYYLNAHHVDLLAWINKGSAKPVRVAASASTGVADHPPYELPAEDLITLVVDWETRSGNRAVAVHTASWVEPESDVHSQQGFTCIMHTGRVEVQQDQRGYRITADGKQVESRNPLFMKYSPDADGYFNGQNGYGYLSIAAFVDAVGEIVNGQRAPGDYDGLLATLRDSAPLTAVLEAGRRSLDEGGRMSIEYGNPSAPDLPTGISPCGV